MGDMIISKSIGSLTEALKQRPKVEPPADDSFGKMMVEAVEDVNRQMTHAGKAVEALTTGANKDIHGTMIAMEKATVSFQLLSQVRNKIIDAYKEVQRMSF